MAKKKKLKLINTYKKYIVVVLALSLGLATFGFGYAYKDNLPCIIKSFSFCVTLKEYKSANGKFSFKYPKDYLPVFKTGDDLVKQYGWMYNPGSEWVQFRNKFLPTSSLDDQSDNLADITVEKATDYKNLEQYKNMVLEQYRQLSAISKSVPKEVTYTHVSGQEALHIAISQTNTFYLVPDDGFIFFYDGDIYELNFHKRGLTDKKALQSYENAKEVIVSTFHINKQAYELQKTKDSSKIPTPAYENQQAMIRELPEVLPSGWKKDSDTQFRKTLNGITYTADFQLNNQEYLRKGGNFASDLSLIKSVKTQKGTNVYIVSEGSDYGTTGYIYVSSCKPTKYSACSLPFGNQLLFVMLHVYRFGAQEATPLNFHASGIDTIIQEFTQIIESSNF